MEKQHELKNEVNELLGAKKWGDARELLRELPAPDIADFLLDLDKSDRILLFRLLPRLLASEVFSYLEARKKDDLLRDLTEEETRGVLAGLSPDDRTTFFEELPGEATQRLINLLSPEDRRETLQLLGFPEQSVGRLMTPDYVAVRPGWTVGRALEHIRVRGKNSETINVVYVVDSSWKLIDALDLRRFVLAPMELPAEQAAGGPCRSQQPPHHLCCRCRRFKHLLFHCRPGPGNLHWMIREEVTPALFVQSANLARKGIDNGEETCRIGAPSNHEFQSAVLNPIPKQERSLKCCLLRKSFVLLTSAIRLLTR